MLRLVVASPGSAPASRPASPHVVTSDPSGFPLAYGWQLGDDHWLSVPDVATFRFRPGSEIVLGYAEPGAEAEWVAGAYLDAALPMAIQVALGRQALHASGVLASGGVVAFCGESQSGKTTIAYGLSRRGGAIWADDIVALDTLGEARVNSLRAPFELNLRPASAKHFGKEGKARGAFTQTAEWQTAPILALYVLEQLPQDDAQGQLSVEQLIPKEAFLALLGHAWVFLPLTAAAKRRMLTAYLDVIARAPVFRLRYAKDFAVLPRVLDAIEETMNATN